MAVRRKQWVGGLSSIAAQVALFIPVDLLLGHWISALLILAINIGLAATYRSTNPYLQGARWATFISLSMVSVARHTYWYESMLESFVRLSDFDRPLNWNTMLCQGNLEAGIITASTSALVICFYYLTPKWPEWTDRWEMLRRAPFSASLGFQVIITMAVVWPTPLGLTSALFFAGVISPIIRRQVRLNHIVFLMLTPLFALGVPELAFFWGLVCGSIFLYWVAVERTMTLASGSFAFFNGVAFLALALATSQAWLTESGASPGQIGSYSIFCLCVFMGLSYWLLISDQKALDTIRKVIRRTIPEPVAHSPWWNIRDLWVDREVAHRVGKLFKWKDQDKTIGYFFFGPKYWAPRSETFDRVPFPRLNLTPAILVLTIYSFFQGVDSALFLTSGSLTDTLTRLGVAFAIILGVPIWLLAKQVQKGSGYNPFSITTSALTLLVLALYMASIFYFGTTSTDRLNSAAENLEQRTGFAEEEQTNLVLEEDCSCHKMEEPMGLPGKDGI